MRWHSYQSPVAHARLKRVGRAWPPGAPNRLSRLRAGARARSSGRGRVV